MVLQTTFLSFAFNPVPKKCSKDEEKFVSDDGHPPRQFTEFEWIGYGRNRDLSASKNAYNAVKDKQSNNHIENIWNPNTEVIPSNKSEASDDNKSDKKDQQIVLVVQKDRSLRHSRCQMNEDQTSHGNGDGDFNTENINQPQLKRIGTHSSQTDEQERHSSCEQQCNQS